MNTAPILAFALVCTAGLANAQAQISRFDELANAPFKENRPTKETTQILQNELLFHRATQAYLWALPLINTLGMQGGSEKVFGKGYNVLPIFKNRLDAKTLITTPNSDVIYALTCSAKSSGSTGMVSAEDREGADPVTALPPLP
jgi:hypothetical protein